MTDEELHTMIKAIIKTAATDPRGIDVGADQAASSLVFLVRRQETQARNLIAKNNWDRIRQNLPKDAEDA